MDPGSDEVQVAWEDGTVANARCSSLNLGGVVVNTINKDCILFYLFISFVFFYLFFPIFCLSAFE